MDSGFLAQCLSARFQFRIEELSTCLFYALLCAFVWRIVMSLLMLQPIYFVGLSFISRTHVLMSLLMLQ